jgi:hypothetical protein
MVTKHPFFLVFHPVTSAKRQDRVLPAQRVDPTRVLELGELPSQISFTQPADLVLVEIPYEIAHALGRCPVRRLHAVSPQPIEYIGAIPEGTRLTQTVVP